MTSRETELHQKLFAAGIIAVSVHSNGHIDFDPSTTLEQRTLAASIMANYDPIAADAAREITKNLEKAAMLESRARDLTALVAKGMPGAEEALLLATEEQASLIDAAKRVQTETIKK